MSNEIRGPEQAPAEAGLGPAAPSVEFESMTVCGLEGGCCIPALEFLEAHRIIE